MEPYFSPCSLKGLSSPVWVRMPNLPLYCWDEINVARIASLIGTPLLLDGDMFQWGRREFARVCVRLELDKPLPLGVWVEGVNGRFFQKVEYEKISSLCFSCGRVELYKEVCGVNSAKTDEVSKASDNSNAHLEIKTCGNVVGQAYGPWILVNQNRRRNTNVRIGKPTHVIPRKSTTVYSMEKDPVKTVNEADNGNPPSIGRWYQALMFFQEA
ncbi:hypothetical protein M5K25_012996 [Dendrobium thyrsiflorum]|uniref:DUF4283 domain-containing protein n=1 Tax=Dendrobium thyrsiflorum TaxID=117978 RepID=A0ABD0V663_DENTH